MQKEGTVVMVVGLLLRTWVALVADTISNTGAALRVGVQSWSLTPITIS